MENVVKAGIMDLVAGSDLVSLLTGFYYGKAPQNAPKPHAVFHALNVDSKRDSASKFENVTLAISAYDDTLSSENIGNIGNACKTLFDDCEGTLLIDGYYVLRIEREFYAEMPDQENGWIFTTQYELRLQKI